MPNDRPEPPPVVDSARLLHHLPLNDSDALARRTLLFVDGKEVGRVRGLAICKDARFEEVFLFHCDRDWDVLGCAGYPTVDDAKARAEHLYPGTSSRWIDSRFTDEEVERYLDELWGDDRCGICGKRGDQVEEMYAEDGENICDACLGERDGH
jgi:hypothetical protein